MSLKIKNLYLNKEMIILTYKTNLVFFLDLHLKFVKYWYLHQNGYKFQTIEQFKFLFSILSVFLFINVKFPLPFLQFLVVFKYFKPFFNIHNRCRIIIRPQTKTNTTNRRKLVRRAIAKCGGQGFDTFWIWSGNLEPGTVFMRRWLAAELLLVGWCSFCFEIGVQF